MICRKEKMTIKINPFINLLIKEKANVEANTFMNKMNTLFRGWIKSFFCGMWILLWETRSCPVLPGLAIG